MRFLLLLPLALGLVLGAALPASAGSPNYSAEDLIFVQEDIPQGWTLADEGGELPAGLPTEEALTGCGGESVDSFEITVSYRVLKHTSGAKAVVAIVDVDTEDGPDAYRSGVDQHATASGWTVTELGDPTRLLVIAAPPEYVPVLTKWHTELAARKLTEMAYYRILSDHAYGKPGKTSQERADEYSKAAAELVPDLADVHVIRGLLKLYEGELVDGIKLIDKGSRTSGALAAYPGLVAFALTMQGRYMIEAKKPELEADAIAVYKRAIAMKQTYMDEAAKLKTNSFRVLAWENQYNLACLQAKRDDKDAAYESLRAAYSLSQMIFPEANYLDQYRHLWYRDEDLASLRSDGERWEKLLADLKPKDFNQEEEEKTKAKWLEEKAKRDKQKAEEKAAKEKGHEGQPG